MATRIEIYTKRLSALKTEMQHYQPHWRDLFTYIKPRSHRFLAYERWKAGNTRNTNIINNTATKASQTLSAGFMSGVTNPARLWFLLKTPFPEINERHEAKLWLDTARKRVAEVLLKSNLYSTLPTVYDELGIVGMGAMEEMEDDESVVRFYHYPVGSYFLAYDERGKLSAVYRELTMTVDQLISRFGISNVSQSVASLYNSNELDKLIEVVRVVERNPDHNQRKMPAKFKRFRSVWFEKGNNENKFLSESGFDEMPVIVPRWEVMGEETYASSCPGMVALGDIMALQVEERRKSQLIDKSTNPPLQVPGSLKRKQVDQLPGGLTYVDISSGQEGIRTLYDTDLRGLQPLTQDIAMVERRIDTAFFKDLFLMISDIERSGVTAFEIAQKEQEKLLALGPVYLRINDELLDSLIERTFNIMRRRSEPYWKGLANGEPLLPKPPAALMNVPIQIEYVSTLSQAMKSVGVQGVERWLTFVGNSGQAFPSMLDIVNPDAVGRNYAEMLGVASEMLNAPEVVEKLRSDREQRAQMQEGMAMAEQGAAAAKDLSAANLGDNNALAQMLGRMGQPGTTTTPAATFGA